MIEIVAVCNLQPISLEIKNAILKCPPHTVLLCRNIITQLLY